MAVANEETQFLKYEETSPEQLLEAQAHIWSHMFSFMNSMSLKCALQLGIPDIIHSHAKPMTLSQLVGALGINKAKSQSIFHLMRILTHSKFFMAITIPGTNRDGEDEEDEESYWLTPASLLLLKDKPWTLAPLVLVELDPILTESSHHMSEWLLREDYGLSSFEVAHGKTLWEHAGQDSTFNAMFNLGVSCDTLLVTHALVKECKKLFEGIELVVDVAGGIGTMAKAIVDAFPGMKCTVLDLPHVVAGLEGTSNVTYVGGDMFQSIPPADAVLLKLVLHDWNDEDSVRILKKCKEAITNKGNVGGKVIIIDMVVDDFGKGRGNEDTEAKLLCDMAMMSCVNGKERSEEEWAKLFVDAGFTSSYKIHPCFALKSLIEVYL